MIKDPYKNSLTATIHVEPIPPDFDEFDFSQLIDMGLPEGT